MDNMETNSETNAKISDSAYSNSCSNSQSRRSHSSKSTHSGSNSSGSSGYGGQPSTSGSSNVLGQPPEKRSKDKDNKKKKQIPVETSTVESDVRTECRPPESTSVFVSSKEETRDVAQTPSTGFVQADMGVENMEIGAPERSNSNDEIVSCNTRLVKNVVSSRISPTCCADGFSCVISMEDGVVMYTTPSLTASLGFPKDMWIGRSFIDFVHPKDRCTFASQITNGLAAPKTVNGVQNKDNVPGRSVSTMFCRIRRYRGLNCGFGVKERVVSFMPFLLRLSFKNVNDDDGKIIYLVIQATPFFSAFKIPNETVAKAVPFVIRHVSNGNLEYIDPESVPYLGYLPQDIVDKDALQLYHPEDLTYLQQVYELIVKEGGVPRSKPYRMLTQNGDYLKLETEWSSFINPWSRKLEFVIAKHHIIEGPTNPDVFQTPEPKKAKISDEEKNKIKTLRDNIIRTMNEVLTKPAELAKQQMSKRCQDLATFMESLMEEQPKADDELRLDIHDPDHSYYERDSVMLGGISPHHDFNDSKASSETPLSYNQLNYNENLQRYFESHQPNSSVEDYGIMTCENALMLKVSKPPSKCLSPVAQNSGDSADMNSSGESSGFVVGSSSTVASLVDYQSVRLTESLLIKHNTEMEKDLVKKHRENRTSSKVDREKISNQMRQKKKEHLARCNAAFQPTTTVAMNIPEIQPHGLKRTSKQAEGEEVAHKQHRGSPRQIRRKLTTSAAASQTMPTLTTTVAASHWSTGPVNNVSAYMPGMIQPQMSLVSPVAAVTDMLPMYYVPTAGVPMPNNSDLTRQEPSNSSGQYNAPPMQYMMYGQAVFGSPFVYSQISPQMSFPVQQTLMPQSMQYHNATRPLELTTSNYEEACKSSLPPKMYTLHAGNNWRDKKRSQSQAISSKAEQGSGVNSSISSSTKALNRSNKTTPGNNSKNTNSRLGNSDEGRTDGESSYSSFYSSFFKTESGSAEDSGDNKKGQYRTGSNADLAKNRPKRKIEPPWMEQVCVTSELIYKYQILSKNMDEVLTADKEKITKLEQPSMVNEQLGQLYLDLQLEGVAARLTLEEGITSSGSSGEDTALNTTKAKAAKNTRRKREYSKLVMIYEEDAPLPSPSEDEEPEKDS